jgi:3-phosphoshikimate 1-carboxyvinyltransferase
MKVPGDKSISHRALIIGGVAEGETTVDNFLPGEDCLATLSCLKALGINIESSAPDRVRITGKGLCGLSEPTEVLDAKNSGTTMRLLLGILAGQPFFSVITGDASLRKRPMGRVSGPLRDMGAAVMGRQDGNLAPLAVKGGGLKPIAYESPVSSAQVKSAVLLAGLYAPGRTSVSEPALSRDHTERMLQDFGANVTRDGLTVTLSGRPVLNGRNIHVPGDISSAAFLIVAACIVDDATVKINKVGLNPTRTGILETLQQMGADIEITRCGSSGGEPFGDITARSSDLRGVEISGELIPRLIDEIPVLAVAAACANGTTVIRDAEELRFKESNRLKAMAEQLNRLGVKLEERTDGLVIKGGRRLSGAKVDSLGDHRVAMALVVAGLVAQGETCVTGTDAISVSFPGFMTVLSGLKTNK